MNTEQAIAYLEECIQRQNAWCDYTGVKEMRLAIAALREKQERENPKPLTLEEVAELAKAKADGRLVVLPCKVGDTVYETLFEWDCTECLKTSFKPKVRERKVTHFILAKSGDIILGVAGNGANYLIYGKTVFLTREEAEAALQKEAQHE